MTTPYRDGKKVDAVIPPDRRKQRALMMIGGGALAGALVIQVVHTMSSPATPAEPPEPPATTGVLPGPITRPEVDTVVSRMRADLRERCFTPQTQLTKANVAMDIVIGRSGEVTQTHYEGSDARVTACVDREVRQWRFPAHSVDSPSTRIPFFFERT